MSDDRRPLTEAEVETNARLNALQMFIENLFARQFAKLPPEESTGFQKWGALLVDHARFGLRVEEGASLDDASRVVERTAVHLEGIFQRIEAGCRDIQQQMRAAK
jgi:hypothetical protein